MKTFQGNLPDINYVVKTKNLDKFLNFLNAYGVDTRDQDTRCRYVQVLCGLLYKVTTSPPSDAHAIAITPKQFKKLVREAVGEPE